MSAAPLAAVLAFATAVPALAQTFHDVTDAAGIDYVQFRRGDDIPAAMQTYTTGGVAAGDYDGDGLVDLYVTAWTTPTSCTATAATAASRT